MALNLDKNLKLYYSIGEVAKMFDLNESTLRYWEKEFPHLKPKTKGPSMVRQYSENDIEQIKLIHNLVKVRGYKLSAAKRIINRNKTGVEKTMLLIDKLSDIRDELMAMKRQIDSIN